MCTVAEARSRRGRWLLWVGVCLVVVVAVSGALYSVLRTGFFAHNLARYATRRYLAGTPFTISIDKLQGNPFRDVTIKGLKIHYAGAEGAFDLLRREEAAR